MAEQNNSQEKKIIVNVEGKEFDLTNSFNTNITTRKVGEKELQFISDNYRALSDADMAKHLGIKTSTVGEYRKRLGLYRSRKSNKTDKVNTFDETIEEMEYEADHLKHNTIDKKLKETTINKEKEANEESTPEELQDLGPDDPSRYWILKFIKSPKGNKIKSILNREDWKFFLQEWGSYHNQLQDLTHAEENVIESLIFLKIRGMANQSSVSALLRDKEMLGDIPTSQLDFTSEDDQQYLHKMTTIDAKIQDLNKEYKDLLDKQNILMRSLNVSREQREAKGKITRDTFFSLCEAFKKSSIRKDEDRNTRIVKEAIDKNMDKLRYGIVFDDGTVAPQLLDDITVENVEKFSKLDQNKEYNNIDTDNTETNDDNR